MCRADVQVLLALTIGFSFPRLLHRYDGLGEEYLLRRHDGRLLPRVYRTRCPREFSSSFLSYLAQSQGQSANCRRDVVLVLWIYIVMGNGLRCMCSGRKVSVVSAVSRC